MNSRVGLTRSMDGALHPAIAKVRVPFPRSSLHFSGSFSTAYVVHSTAMIILISLSYISIHVICHELTMTCSPVGLISSMDRALSLGPNPGQDWIFLGSFCHPPTLFILLRWSQGTQFRGPTGIERFVWLNFRKNRQRRLSTLKYIHLNTH